MTTCTPTCPNYPQCFDPTVDCNSGGVEPLAVPCAPNTTWHHCSQIFIPTPLNPVGGGTTNSCGCYMNDEQNKPSGCIQVRDTQFPVGLDYQGVRRLKVYVKDLYFFGRETWTNHEGCWLIDHRYFGGIHPWIDWYNSNISFRAMRGFDYTQLGHHLKQNCGTHGGGIYNDFQVQHISFADNSSIRRTFWVASTSMNAFYEFNGYANAEGIGTAHGANALSFWLLNGDAGSAAAPMLKHLQTNTSLGNVVGTSINLIGSLFLPLGGYIAPTIAANLPDVLYNYGISGLRSDGLKELCYHELAHVSHYRGLPAADRDNYWWANILRIVSNDQLGDNPPYGSANTTGAGRTAIMESWASHIGSLFADKQYGVKNSFSASALSTRCRKQVRRFIYRRIRAL